MYNCTKEIDKNVITLFTRDGKSFALEQLKLKVKSIQKSHVWCTKVKSRRLKLIKSRNVEIDEGGKKKREGEKKSHILNIIKRNDSWSHKIGIPSVSIVRCDIG